MTSTAIDPVGVLARRHRIRDAGHELARTVSHSEYHADADDLNAGDRAALREFLTPKRAIGGALVWPVDELRGGYGD